MPIIQILLARLSKSNALDEIIVATSEDQQDDQLQTLVEKLGYRCLRGSEKDVLKRVYEAAKLAAADVVRITGDCPLIDPAIVDECIHEYWSAKVDYVSNTITPTFPDGLDVEVASFASLERANFETQSNYDREHVTPYIKGSEDFSRGSIKF